MTKVAEKKAVTQPDRLVESLVSFSQNLTYDKLPKEVVHEVKRRVIDSLGCAMGGFLGEPGKFARALVTGVKAPDYGSTLLGTFNETSPEMAAFANGLLVRYLDYNDTYLSLEPAHPSDNIAPILALAEPELCDGKDLITAIALAYEVQCRLCDAASIRARGWDHVTYGAFSATLGAAKILDLNAKQTEHAMAIAGDTNVNMRQTRVGELSHWKGAAFAGVSRNAVFAARLAWHGMTGPSHIFEGEMGFEKQVSGSLGDLKLGQDGFMINRTSIKFWPAEYHSQSAIDAALQLREELGGDYEQIESIDIESFDAAVDIIGGEEEKWFPKSRETADHSMPYCVAVALIDGQVDLEQFDQKHLNDSRISDLIQKVRMHRNDELTRGYPEGIPNKLIIKTKDGRELVKQVDYPRGHAKNPMTDQEVEDKFRRLASRVLAPRQINFILESLWDLENQRDLTEILEAFNV